MLIGRDAERRVIEQLVAGARVGAAGVLLVTGEPGIGKTALLDEAAALAGGLQILRARGTEAERELPFAGLLQLLRPALAGLDRIPGPQRSALSSALALGPDPGSPADRFAVGAATLSLLCRYAESTPLALLIDDAHLLDRPSAEALLFAARRLVADPIAMVIAARSQEPHPFEADLPRLQLQGIPLEAARQIVQHLPSELVERLHQTVAGNPLALLELADDPDRLQRMPPGVPFPVPAMLAEAFASRANRLSADARTALLVAALDNCELAAVSRVCTELGVDVAALEEAEAAGLVFLRDGEVQWRHPLVRSAIYTSADPAERRTAHRAVALSTPDRDRRAWHLSEAVLGADDEVAAGLDDAAEHAAARGAHAVAATAYERAGRLSKELPDRAVRLVAAGEAAWSAGMAERAELLLGDALILRPPLPVRIRAQAVRGDIEVKCGSPRRARDILVAAAAESTDPAIATGLLADAVGACFRLCDATAGLEVAYQLDSLLPAVDRPGPRIIGMLASGVAKVLAGSGGTDQIRAAIALAPSDELDRDRRRQVWMVLAALFLRETGTGRALLQQAMLERREQVALGTLPGLLFVLARDDATTDRWADAEASYDEGIRLSRETGQTTELAMNLAGLAWLLSHQGRAECQELAVECLRICAEHEIHLGTVWSLFALGDLELGRGDPAAALPQYERLVDVLAEYGLKDPDLSPAPELVEVYLRLGRMDEAQRVMREHTALAEAKGQPWSLARAARTRGVAGDSEADFVLALGWHQETLDAFELARTRLAYGAWLRRARRRVDARTQLRLAVEGFDALGAPRWADQAAAELKATGETARRRVPSTADELTPQERQIAVLLADGNSIREAAARLFLSPKTVEYHLRKVYAKLGIHSRSELIDHLGRT
ncbi:helix-turn-helix transcriptional regulator [Kribbella shirazensis]|uniref:DNA-binding CsgD family transcriptional regulator n=1 Tax=Kribbella shirazensis TaxID=1105143 RepID=A0A7X5V9K1_9ACTN|nr:helix-turn-helix transcriptional regulator [Kribbella shirazensis]NIK57135.1 DNA-binding CsgD family transcriptional regulator [Kribbella shirazensis]